MWIVDSATAPFGLFLGWEPPLEMRMTRATPALIPARRTELAAKSGAGLSKDQAGGTPKVRHLNLKGTLHAGACGACIAPAWRTGHGLRTFEEKPVSSAPV